MTVSVARSFEPEVTRAFRFLVTEHALVAEYGPNMVQFSGPGVAYMIVFDLESHAVSTSVARDLGAVRLVSELPALVRSAALGNPAAVPCGAGTLTEMRASINAHAHYIRRLQPYLTPLNVRPLMRAAHARELRSA